MTGIVEQGRIQNHDWIGMAHPIGEKLQLSR